MVGGVTAGTQLPDHTTPIVLDFVALSLPPIGLSSMPIGEEPGFLDEPQPDHKNPIPRGKSAQNWNDRESNEIPDTHLNPGITGLVGPPHTMSR
ncbi:MAG: hypothetical protein ETSY2_28635 [Candidatus Entotheonella gemina]|uniref:Uncharacterized protein n=1 Tax=Candidatus Entotheonella gemina TaxID=1429439 RepID=W4M4A9_9BACT|nr:MAG: hypothetical protein ETSY2_28635 [Candidatus Entotheonella gemina]